MCGFEKERLVTVWAMATVALAFWLAALVRSRQLGDGVEGALLHYSAAYGFALVGVDRRDDIYRRSFGTGWCGELSVVAGRSPYTRSCWL